MPFESAESRALLWKVPLAVVLMAGIVAAAARDLMPADPLVVVLLYAAAATVALLVVVVAWAAVVSAWRQHALNHGATDVAWLKFGAQPPGLQALRGSASNTTKASGRR